MDRVYIVRCSDARIADVRGGIPFTSRDRAIGCAGDIVLSALKEELDIYTLVSRVFVEVWSPNNVYGLEETIAINPFDVRDRFEEQLR